MACPLATERVWTDKVQYHAAEKQYHEYLSKLHNTGTENNTNSENPNQISEADESRFKSPVKKMNKNKKKRQQRVSIADDDASLDATVSDSTWTRDLKVEPKKNNKKNRNLTQSSDATAMVNEKTSGGKNKPQGLLQQSSMEDESIAHETKSPTKKTRNHNKGKIQAQLSAEDKMIIDLDQDEFQKKMQNKNQSKRGQQQRVNSNDYNMPNEQKSGSNKKDSKSKVNDNETDSMKRQKNKQNAKKNPIWTEDDRNLPSTTEEPNEQTSLGFETQAHPDDAESRNDSEKFIEVPTKRKRSRRVKKDKVTPFANFIANDGKTNSSRSESISSIDVQSVDIIIAEEAGDITKDIKELENIVHQQKSSDNLALKESNDNRIYDTVVNVVDNILKEQVKNRGAGPSSLASEIAKARQHIKNSLERMDGIAALASTPSAELLDRLSSIEKQNAQLQSTVNNLQNIVDQLQEKIRTLELGGGKPTVQTVNTSSQVTKSPPAPAAAKPNEDEDDGVDLFGSDSEDEDEAAAKVREQRLADYAAKKSKKVALIAKSNVILDIKPWSDETDLKEMEEKVRAITMDGLLWGAAKQVHLAYGIYKLQISTVVEDEKVSIDDLQEQILSIEELVQSVDIAAFNKI